MAQTTDHQRVAEQLTATTNRSERTRAVQRLAEHFGVTKQTIYAWARKGGWSSGRSKRADAGQLAKQGLTDEHFKAVFAHLSRPNRRAKKPPVEKAILTCERAGAIPPGAMTPSIFYRHCQRQGLDWRGDWSPTRARDTYVNMKSLPQEVHQIDASVYALWYVRDDGSLDVYGSEKTDYKNRPRDEKVRVIRWIVVDHCTGAFYVWYTPDEKITSLARVLHEAWALKTRHVSMNGSGEVPLCEVLPFSGVPQRVYWDLHGTHWSEEIQHLLRALRVECLPTRPESPRSHGSVESHHVIWERWFELDQGCDPPETLSELQRRADSMCAFLNSAREHTRYKRTRSDAWHTYVAEHPEVYRPVVPWEIFQRLVQKADERVVRPDGKILYDGKQFRLPRDLWAEWRGQTVAVHVSPFRQGWIDVQLGDRLISLAELRLDEFGQPADANHLGSGEIKSSPTTPRETQTRSIREETDLAGVGTHHDSHEQVPQRFAPITPVMGSPIEQPAERTFTEIEARQQILQAFSAKNLTDQQRAILAAVNGTQSETEIEQAIQQMESLAG